MIRDIRRPYYRNLALFFLAVVGVGFLLGYPLLALLLAVTGCLVWQLYQLGRLIEWLRGGARSEPPDAGGLWGMVFDHFYGVQRKHHRQIRHYQKVISRIQTSTQALRDGVIQLDQYGTLQWWNPAAGELLGLKPRDEGQLLINLVRDPAFGQFYHQGDNSESLRLENPAHPERTIDVSMTVYGRGERLLLVRDSTRIEQLERMRQDFVANASHELKTPLTVLKGYLESILTFAEDLPPALNKGLTSMETQTRRMDNLVNDLLVLTRLDAEVRPSAGQRVEVKTLLDNIASEARALSGERGHDIQVSIESQAALLGDPRELESAIGNLVYNAVNYSPDGRDILLRWHSSESGGCISVRDEGIGIDPRHIPRLTERFYRVDPGRSSERGGTGLGLAIVKHILQHHQAHLDIASVPGRGSVFTACFPPERVLPSGASAAAESANQTA